MLEKIEGRRRRRRQRTRWHHPFNRHEFEQTQGDGEGQGSLMCYSPWGRKESDRTEQLNNNLWDLLGGDEIIHIKSLAVLGRDKGLRKWKLVLLFFYLYHLDSVSLHTLSVNWYRAFIMQCTREG